MDLGDNRSHSNGAALANPKFTKVLESSSLFVPSAWPLRRTTNLPYEAFF